MGNLARLILIFALTGAPVSAQDASIDANDELDEVSPRLPLSSAPLRVGQTAETTAGRAGERQTRAQTEGIEPLARIGGRIPTRVESRIRSRIDRNYDPQATTISPFEVAGEQTQRAGQRPRR